jgi:hypothetical protein
LLSDAHEQQRADVAARIDLGGVNYLTAKSQGQWQPRTRGAIDTARWTMQMHQIRYFLALCEERNFIDSVSLNKRSAQ